MEGENAIVGKGRSFQKDGAISHPSLPATAFLKHHAPVFIKNWPLNSPDLNPLDYAIWSILASNVNAPGPPWHSGIWTRAQRIEGS